MTKQRILQNNLLLWIDGSIDENEADTQHTLQQLRAIVHHVTVFTTIDACMQYLQQLNRERALVITSGCMGVTVVEHIHSLAQVEAIYILCENVARHEVWTKTWSKIRGVHNRIRPICEALQTVVKQSNDDLTPISFVQQEIVEGGSEVDLNRLEPSFMYTTLFKRFFLDMEREPNEQKGLIKFCRAQFRDTNSAALQLVEEFNSDYRADRAIWWYTRPCFLYEMLNRALRLLESDIIVDLGFFLRDLHRQLQQLHHEQFDDYHQQPLTLFRGQGLTIDDFSKLKKTQGGLIAFNSFISTSQDRSVSMAFAETQLDREGMVGILFVMIVDPKIDSATFANIEKHSYFANEAEILFSMHTVFRVAQLTPLDESQRLFEVQLKLTSDDDPTLRPLIHQLEKDIEGEGWHRVGVLLYHVAQVNKAEELYLALLEREPDEHDRCLYYHHMGLIKSEQGDNPQALEYYKKAIAIEEKILSPTDFYLAASYNNIGSVYESMDEYSQALSYYSKALDIQEKTLADNHPSFAFSYSNIGLVYKSMGEYAQALSFFDKALNVQKTTLPDNHPSFATSWNNIGGVYMKMRDYSQALSYFNKALTIEERTLPANHPQLASCYHNIGELCQKIGEHSQALSYFNKALNIEATTVSANHLSLANSWNNIGALCLDMGEYSRALSYLDKALDILEKTLPANHSLLATCHSNIGGVYMNMRDYSKALFYFNKALSMEETTLPDNHPSFATSWNNIGGVYMKMCDYSQALSYFNKALTIEETTLPPNHPQLANYYHRIGISYYALKQYSTALPYFQKAFDIRRDVLPPGHPNTEATLEWLKDVQEKL